jgi:hypothetical protein
VSDLYEVAIIETDEGLRLRWSMREDREAWRSLREGASMLRTNLPAVV